jgi:amidophosphoribosyltransferase
LIASRKTVEELRDYLGLDSLYYLSIDGLLKATEFKHPEENFCKACFDGCYPVTFDMHLTKDCLESN